MMRRNSRKLLTTFMGLILTFACLSIYFSVDTLPKAYAQEKSTAVGAEKIKTMLLRPDGWLAEWYDKLSLMQGTHIFIFEARGENVVVKIKMGWIDKTCERNVTITSDGAKTSTCYGIDFTLFFDNNDHKYPFKGENQDFKVKLKAK